MSRLIDQTPEVRNAKRVKVILPCLSRNGTLSVYKALNILGFKAYHMMEVMTNEIPDAIFLKEYVEAAVLGKGERFTKKDFDKWMGEYDAIVEIPCFGIDDFLAAYLPDPDTKFILIERDPAAWARSWTNTIGKLAVEGPNFPFRQLRPFDRYLDDIFSFLNVIMNLWSNGKGIGEEGRREAVGYYEEYHAKVKRLIPPERMLCLRLEDGLGWEQLCPYLGYDIPDVPFPSKHSTVEFEDTVKFCINRAMRRAALKMVGSAVLTLGGFVAAGYWYWFM